MVGEAVRHVGRLGRVAHADEIRRHTSPARGHVRDDVAPDVRRGPVPVEEEDGRAVDALSATRRSSVNIAHLQPKHGRSVESEWEVGGDIGLVGRSRRHFVVCRWLSRGCC